MQTDNTHSKYFKMLIIGLPIVILVAVFSTVLIVKKNHVFTTVQEQPRVASLTTLEPITSEEPGIISNNIYVKNLDKRIQIRKLDYTVVYYAKMFKLDTKKVLDLTHSLTNNYQDEEYNKNFIIAPAGQKWRYGPYKSYEAGIVEFIRELYTFPSRFGMSNSEIRASETVTIANNYRNGHIILSGGITFEQLLEHLCSLYDMDKDMALAIIRHESGNMKSWLSINKNNIGGQLVNGVGVSYPTMDAGLVAEVVLLKNLFDKCGLDKSSTKDLYTFSGMYVHGDLSAPAPDWHEKVLAHMSIIKKTNPFVN